MSEAIKSYGWEAKPRDPAVFLDGKKNFKDPEPQTVESIKLPDSPIAKAVLEYARKELNVETFNHSMRVFYYGILPSIANNLGQADALFYLRQSHAHTTVSKLGVY